MFNFKRHYFLYIYFQVKYNLNHINKRQLVVIFKKIILCLYIYVLKNNMLICKWYNNNNNVPGPKFSNHAVERETCMQG